MLIPIKLIIQRILYTIPEIQVPPIIAWKVMLAVADVPGSVTHVIQVVGEGKRKIAPDSNEENDTRAMSYVLLRNICQNGSNERNYDSKQAGR
jgi:hypothetical protein